jgi:olefin beta-lactone synthetase
VIDADGLWHRTGDLGALDEDGILWLAGRSSHVVRTRAHGALCSVRWEGVFEAHPAVRRAALVGVGDDPEGQTPVVCIELHTSARDQDHASIERALRTLAEACPVTRPTPTFLFHDGFPVDIRHNAKIVREELAAWAAMRLGLSPLVRPSLPMLVPLLGWLFVLVGLLVVLPPVLALVWWIDVVLSVFAHAAQLVRALPIARRAGHSDAATIALTLLLGATWWRRLPPLDRPSIVVRE